MVGEASKRLSPRCLIVRDKGMPWTRAFQKSALHSEGFGGWGPTSRAKEADILSMLTLGEVGGLHSGYTSGVY